MVAQLDAAFSSAASAQARRATSRPGAPGARSRLARIADSPVSRLEGAFPNRPREAAPMPCSSPRKLARIR
jgi:hypothetical protein